MIVYGRNAVREALRGPREVRRAWATGRAAEEPWLEGVEVRRVESAAELERLCGTSEHQGVCAETGPYPYADAGGFLSEPDPLIVGLDEVQDPQNLGAVCRSAEAAGVTGLVIPERRSAEVTPAVCKASAGAVEHLPVARVRNLADYLAACKDAGCWVYGTAAEGGVSYDAPDFSGGVVLVLGAEGTGLRPRVAGACDGLLTIPMQGRIESLNVSAAAAIALYEILQQRKGT